MSKQRILSVIGVAGMATVLSLVITTGSTPPGGATGTAPWKTLSVAGKVESQSPQSSDISDWLPVRRGTEVAPLTHVRTSSRARATLTRQGDLILVAARSEVVLPEQQPNGTTVVLQEQGHAIYKVAPRTGGGRFEVRTPLLVAGVKGTRFSVILEEHRAAVSVLEGVVEVRSSTTGETTDLAAGMVAIVDDTLNKMEIHDELGPDRPARGENEKIPARGKKGNKIDDDVLMVETLRTSEKLALQIVETDDSLQVFDTETEQNLWGDLLDADSAVRTTTRTLDQTTTMLDPVTSDPTSDPSLITKLVNMLGRK